MNTTFPTWQDKDIAAGQLVSEAFGWGRCVDPDDAEAVLAWAREYLPRVVALGGAEVGARAMPNGSQIEIAEVPDV